MTHLPPSFLFSLSSLSLPLPLSLPLSLTLSLPPLCLSAPPSLPSLRLSDLPSFSPSHPLTEQYQCWCVTSPVCWAHWGECMYTIVPACGHACYHFCLSWSVSYLLVFSMAIPWSHVPFWTSHTSKCLHIDNNCIVTDMTALLPDPRLPMYRFCLYTVWPENLAGNVIWRFGGLWTHRQIKFRQSLSWHDVGGVS